MLNKQMQKLYILMVKPVTLSYIFKACRFCTFRLVIHGHRVFENANFTANKD